MARARLLLWIFNFLSRQHFADASHILEKEERNKSPCNTSQKKKKKKNTRTNESENNTRGDKKKRRWPLASPDVGNIYTHTRKKILFFFSGVVLFFFLLVKMTCSEWKKKGLWELIFEGLVFDESQTGMCTLTPWLIAALTQGVFFFILNKKEKLNLFFFFKVIYFTQINTPLYFAEEKCLWIVIIITSHTHSDCEHE